MDLNNEKKVDDEKSFEVIQEGVQKDLDAHPHLVRRGLTEVSAMFDRHGKGYLDETERALRRMDSTDRGYLGIDKVCVIFESLQAEQERSSQLLEALRTESKKSLNLKKGVIALAVFTFLLALANVGTSFAVSKLVKDTQVSQGDLIAKSNGLRLGTTSKLVVFEMDSINEERRRLLERHLNVGLVCETMGDTLADGTTEKECSLQGTIKLDQAEDIHTELEAEDRVILTCNLKKSAIHGTTSLPIGVPGPKVMGSGDFQTTYKVFPSGRNPNDKYDADQRVFVPAVPAVPAVPGVSPAIPAQNARYCTANFELAMYCPVELKNGKQQDCLVMTAFLPTDACPTPPVICGPPPDTTTLIN